KQVLESSESEGQAVSMAVCDSILAVATDHCYIKLFDLTRRKIRPHSVAKALLDHIPDLGRVVSVKCNSTGTRVSLLCLKTSGQPDTRLYVWDIDTDTISAFDFN
ncbi:hypothetical protein Ahia01_001237100, partial [Argonauta hians]